MKKYLISENGNFYKANLHCHTTVSDGKLTPAEIKEEYMRHGYSVVAYTDHDVLVPHYELNDENFLALNAYEIEVNESGDIPATRSPKTCHICLVALEPDNITQVCWHRSDYLFSNSVKYADKVKFDETLPDYVREYTHEGINDIIKKGREGGFFVTYNHPCWSREDYSDYSGYEGMNAMEMMNYGCIVVGYEDYNSRVYDDLIKQGKHLFCIGTDDNHQTYDMCGAWTMIKAPALEYRKITSALEAGDFYCSEGPEIKELYVEDGQVHITTSPVRSIVYIAVSRDGKMEGFKETPVTSASFTLRPDHVAFRIQVVDFSGKRAYTNYYFIKDLL